MAGKGKVLLVDDEEIILDVSREVLRFLGYDAAFAKEGGAAIEMYRQAKESGQPFDLVIIDLTIPEGLGGQETIEKLRSYDPEVKAVVSSGYTNDPVMQEYAKYGFSGRLTKPYRINEMKALLESMIQKK
ncbi:response regulator receiver protein [Methanoregula boonei 6A8]|uniref:Response regulator receiver protein n=1 Tax=Methanoregula boonei (strain DSM 21154 / JCM 14090 / 6A8) TaxID=456442 RepID=A7IA45_METB6|nr:response regulator [Methanoregula boonei]ABS56606.1 response regulator receiver protein [Methanoregula boonei 6A8]